MPTFTVELWRAIEYENGDIGLNDYPIFNEAYRRPLNEKIIDHYYNHEIGMETVSMFRLALRRRMNEIMPYYNKLYESELLEINAINTIDMLTESENKTEAVGTSVAENSSLTGSKSRSVQSDFPQHRLSGADDYATAAADSASDSDVTSEATENSNSESDTASKSRTVGTQGSQADMLMRYRESIINVDLMVIEELADCFMAIWNTSDSYTERHIL